MEKIIDNMDDEDFVGKDLFTYVFAFKKILKVEIYSDDDWNNLVETKNL